MRYSRWFIGWVAVLGLWAGLSLGAWAEEMTGQEHAGQMAAGDQASILSQAARALQATNAALAAEARAWAEGKGTGDQMAAFNKIADALEAANPDLAAQVRGLVAKEHAGEEPAGKEHGGKEHGGEHGGEDL